MRARVEELIETSAEAEGFFDECATAITASKEEYEQLPPYMKSLASWEV